MFGWLFKRKEPKCRHYKDAGHKLSNMITIYRFSPYRKDDIGYSITECCQCGVRAFGCVGLHCMSDKQSVVIDLYINHHIGPYDFEKFLGKEMAWFKRIEQTDGAGMSEPLDELTAIAQANGGMGYAKPEQPCEVCQGRKMVYCGIGAVGSGYVKCHACKGTGKRCVSDALKGGDDEKQ